MRITWLTSIRRLMCSFLSDCRGSISIEWVLLIATLVGLAMFVFPVFQADLDKVDIATSGDTLAETLQSSQFAGRGEISNMLQSVQETVNGLAKKLLGR